MKRAWLVPLALALAAALAAYAAAWHACGGRPAAVDRLQDVSVLAAKLGLSAAQAAEVRRLHADLAAELRTCCERHCAARARLGATLVAETNGTAQADALLAEMCRAYEQSERATLAQIRQVRAVLNPEQRRRFDALISDCVCQPCDMPGGRVPPASPAAHTCGRPDACRQESGR